MILLAFSAVYHLTLTRLTSDFWYIDDPGLYDMVSRVEEPWRFFTDPHLIRAGGMDRYLTPWRQVSMWLDQRIAPRSPGFAYLHTIASMLLCTVLMFAVGRRFVPEPIALAASCLWLLPTSTITVIEWLAARHYLEGMVFLAAALWLFLRSDEAEGTARRTWWALGSVLAVVMAALCKEIYMTSAFAMLFCLALHRRRGGVALGLIAAAIGCGIYRIATVGVSAAENLLEAEHLGEFTARIPVLLAGGIWGWLLVPVFLVPLGVALSKRRIDIAQALFWVIQFIIALLPILHLLGHVTAAETTRGDWYRLLIVWNTLWIWLGAWLYARAESGRLALAGLLIALGVLLPYTYLTTTSWDARKADYAREGRYYLANPDHLLYSSQPGYFLEGLHRLHQDDRRAHFVKDHMANPMILYRSSRYREVWGDVGGRIAVIPDGHRILWLNAEADRRPLRGALTPAQESRRRAERASITVEDDRILIRQPGYLPELPLLDLDLASPWEDRAVIPVEEDGPPALLITGIPDTLELAAHDARSQLLPAQNLVVEGDDLAIVPLSGLVPPETRLIELRAGQPFKAWTLHTTPGGAVDVAPILGSSTGTSLWLAHLTTGDYWTTRVEAFLLTDDPVEAVVYPLDRDGVAMPPQSQVLAGRTNRIPIPEGAAAARLLLTGEAAVRVSYRDRFTGLPAHYQPGHEPGRRFALTPVADELEVRMLAVLETSGVITRVRLTDRNGEIFLDEAIGANQKRVWNLPADAAWLESDASLVCLLLERVTGGPLVAREPTPADD